MADLGSMNDLIVESLEVVNRELTSTLDAARHEIEQFVDGHAGVEALARGAELLHLAGGVLKVVDVRGAALLAGEMEHCCRSLIPLHEGAELDVGLEALTRAMVQLPAYIDRLLSGGRDVPLVLLPLLNDLRTVRGKTPLSEGSLALLGRPLPARKRAAGGGPVVRPATGGAGRELQQLAVRLRPTFQAALLGWIRGDRTNENLSELISVAEQVLAASSSEPVRQLWQLCSAVLLAVRLEALEDTPPLKRVIGQLDRQLKRLAELGEAGFAQSPPTELVDNLLYYVAKADTADERIEAVRRAFDLGDVAAEREQLQEAREVLAGPSVKLMRTVAQAIKEDLASVKDALDIFVRTGMSEVDKLTPQLDMLKKIGDTLGVLGLENARGKIQRQARELGTLIMNQRVKDPAELETVAATLLDVEDMLDRELTRTVTPRDASESDADPDSQTQYRHVTQAVMGECIVNLAKIKEAVAELVDDPGNGRALDKVGPQLKGITAGLLMLSKTKAVGIVERIGEVIRTRLGPRDKPLKAGMLERLADAIVSVEYYMETVSAGRSDPWYMLDNASRCLEVLERVPAAVAPKAPPAPAPAPRPKPEPRPEPPVMEVEPERSDPELLETFIEEMKEEIANIDRYLPVWLEAPEDTEALIGVRRSFHTLKGSGRMVGAQLIGEYAWSIENLLNRLINQTLLPNAEMLEFIGEAVKVLPQLVEQLEIGVKPRIDMQDLMRRADAFAGGEPLPRPAPDAGRTEEAGAQPVPRAEEAEEPPAQMDPVLAEIFVKETRGHLATIREYLERAGEGAQPVTIDEPVYRASHTLLGSANMAGYAPASALAEPLAEQLQLHYKAGSGLGREAVRTLTACSEELHRMTDALAAGDAYGGPSAELLEALKKLAPSSPPRAAEVSETPAAESVSEPQATYDPEIAQIFAEEAAQLLETAETALGDYERGAGPARVAALTELQRLLHTLKGGARMAGVVAMGNLSHALESMLTGLADGRIASGKSALSLLQSSLDELHQMRDAIDAGRGVAEPVALLEQIDRALRGGAGEEEPEPAAPAAPEVQEPPRPEPEPVGTTVLPPLDIGSRDLAEDEHSGTLTGVLELTAEDIKLLEEIDLSAAMPETEEPVSVELEPEEGSLPAAVSALKPEEGAEEEPEGPLPPAADVTGESARSAAPAAPADGEPVAIPGQAQLGPAAPTPRPAERVETTRVDAGLLDALLNHAGEISIFQSRLAQQVHSTEFHLGELGQTVTRLREQLRKLEAETEAQILHRHQEDLAEEEFDPLELDRYSSIQQLSRALAETANDVASINELLRGLSNETDTLLTQQARVTTELQDGLMQTRMVSLQRHVSRLARIVRQAASETGKPTELVVEGAASELDRQVLESMLPPFEHLLRNAVVHGIEPTERRRAAGKPDTGTVTLRLKREGSEVIVEVVDDGAGLDLVAIRRKAREQGLLGARDEVSDEEAMELILKPGFSTAGELTQAAGRGVGMDVVDTEIKKLGGSLRIESMAGQGTRFIIRLPYTLAITQALIVNVGEETFALPLPTVEGIMRLPREDLLARLTEDDPRLEYGDASYKIQHLGSFVGGAPSALPEDDSAVALVLVRAADNSTALFTDSLEGSREIVVKSLGPHLTSVRGVSGATILGDGRIIVILDAPTLVRSLPSERPPAAEIPEAVEHLKALVVDDSITMRRVTQRFLERRGVEVLTARDGLDALTLLQEHTPDIILLDIEMPRMDGYQFASHVRNDSRLRDIPIIMITSRSGEKHRARAIEIGINDYLVKPYQENQLIAAMESLLGRSL